MLTDVRQPSRIPSSTEIGAAYACFDEGRPEETLKLLETVPPDCAVGASLRLAAGALIAERNGNAGTAEEGFEKVFKAGIPLPALLRESGRFFKRSTVSIGHTTATLHCKPSRPVPSTSSWTAYRPTFADTHLTSYAGC